MLLVADAFARAIARPSKGSAVVIVRPDGFGDFVVWLDAARILREHYRDRELILIAHQAFSKLAERSGYFDQVVPLDAERFRSELGYRFRMTRQIRALGAATTLHPVLSRTFSIGDSVVRATGAPDRIGFAGDHGNVSSAAKRLADSYYTRLVTNAPAGSSEFDQHRAFLDGIGLDSTAYGVACIPEDPVFALPADVERPYLVIFPGSGQQWRSWPPERFAKVARSVTDRHALNIVICGSDLDRECCEAVEACLAGMKFTSLVGRTSPVELVEVIRRARLLVANDTSAVHIAAAVQTPSVCIVGGGHYGRFLPYPEGLTEHAPRVVFKRLPCYGCNWHCTQPYEEGDPVPCIQAVDSTAVLDAAESVLAKAGERGGADIRTTG